MGVVKALNTEACQHTVHANFTFTGKAEEAAEMKQRKEGGRIYWCYKRDTQLKKGAKNHKVGPFVS